MSKIIFLIEILFDIILEIYLIWCSIASVVNIGLASSGATLAQYLRIVFLYLRFSKSISNLGWAVHGSSFLSFSFINAHTFSIGLISGLSDHWFMEVVPFSSFYTLHTLFKRYDSLILVMISHLHHLYWIVRNSSEIYFYSTLAWIRNRRFVWGPSVSTPFSRKAVIHMYLICITVLWTSMTLFSIQTFLNKYYFSLMTIGILLHRCQSFIYLPLY